MTSTRVSPAPLFAIAALAPLLAALAPLLAIVALDAGCVLDVAVGEKLCDGPHPCVAGESCVHGRCVAEGDGEGAGEGEGGAGEGEGAAGEGEGEGAGEGEGEGAAGEGEGEGGIDATLRIDAIEQTGCVTASHVNSGNGDDRGGIAWAGDAVIYVGDDATLRANINVLTVQSLFPRRMDGVFSDMNDGSLWELTQLDGSFFRSVDASAEQLTEIDADTGVETGLNVPLSDVLDGLDGGGDRTGVFSGKGKLAIDTGGTVRVIDIATGEIHVAPHTANLVGAVQCESWAVWGVLETFGGQDHIDYIADNAQIIRIGLSDGAREVVAQFTDLGDACSMTIDPTRGRFLFHNEIDSQFVPDIDESLTSCPASICVDDTCTCTGGASLCPDDGCRPLSRDPAHCGDCTHACPGENAACVDGNCGCAGRFPDVIGADCTDFGTDESNCTGPGVACGPTQVCMNGCIDAPDLEVDALSTSSCTGLDVSPTTGSNSHTLAVGSGNAFYSAQSNAVTVSLASPTSIGTTFGAVNAMASDLVTGTAYVMMSGTSPLVNNDDFIDGIAPLSATGVRGTTVALSQIIDVDEDVLGLFSGAGRIAVFSTRGLFIVDPVTGFVDAERAPSTFKPNNCDNDFMNGILEHHDGEDFLVFIAHGAQSVERMRLADESHEQIVSRDLGGNACALALDPANQRWLIASPGTTPLVSNPGGEDQLVACPATLTCASCQ